MLLCCGRVRTDSVIRTVKNGDTDMLERIRYGPGRFTGRTTSETLRLRLDTVLDHLHVLYLQALPRPYTGLSRALHRPALNDGGWLRIGLRVPSQIRTRTAAEKSEIGCYLFGTCCGYVHE